MSQSLPLELWDEIFAFATYLEGSFDINPPNLYHSATMKSPQQWSSNRQEYSLSITTKMAISSVCHAWKAIGASYMYGYVRFLMEESPTRQLLGVGQHSENRDDPRCKAIARHLKQLTSRFSEDAQVRVAHYTRRLDIPFGYLEAGNTDALITFVKACPRLSIFTLEGSPKLKRTGYGPLYDALKSRPALHRLHLKMPLSPELQALYHIPTLISLTMPFSSLDAGHSIVLPQLQNVTLDFFGGTVPATISVRFPSLRTLSILNVASGSQITLTHRDDPLRHFIPFFELNGAEIVSLHLECRFQNPRNATRWKALPDLVVHSPKIKELVVDCSYVDAVIQSLQTSCSVLSGISTLGLICRSEPQLRFVSTALRERFPDLISIRLSLTLRAELSRTQRMGLDTAAGMGIEIRDRRGRVFPCRLSPELR